MRSKLLLYGFWLLATVVLVILAMGYRDTASAILAEVEPQRYAVSFQKPVRIKEIYVLPGQRVKKGEKLLLVERPDLLLDVVKKENSLEILLAEGNRSEIEKESRLTLLRINHEQSQLKITTEIEQLNLILSNNESISRNLQNLQLWADTIEVMSPAYINLRLAQLKELMHSEKRQYQIEINEINQVLELERQNRLLEVEQLRQEIEFLKQEESGQIQYAHVNGTIGNIYSEDEELVPPYETLISIYEDNPTIIRALVNEHMKIDLNSGDEVIVESTNRKYQIQGRVMEIGSRIIEYPGRLKPYDGRPVWGRELFIKIPEESHFLNGEKVFVRLE